MTLELGYALSSEEHDANRLVDLAVQAEASGFSFAMISDHFHPWTGNQGQSPFVWSVLGGIARATRRLEVGTGVTCPIMRTHPAIIAQAAATTAVMFDGRFFLGVGTGERLNEHILGMRWPPLDIRLQMLTEAIDIMKRLWGGDEVSYRGTYFEVEDARLFTLPDRPPALCVAASTRRAAEIAGAMGDGLVATEPEPEITAAFESAGGKGKPRYGHLTVCWAQSREEAMTTAHRIWPNTALPGPTKTELSTPKQYEIAVSTARPDDIAAKLAIGPDPEPYIEAIHQFEEAGFTHVYVHQIGPRQEDFFRFVTKHLGDLVGVGEQRHSA